MMESVVLIRVRTHQVDGRWVNDIEGRYAPGGTWQRLGRFRDNSTAQKHADRLVATRQFAWVGEDAEEQPMSTEPKCPECGEPLSLHSPEGWCRSTQQRAAAGENVTGLTDEPEVYRQTAEGCVYRIVKYRDLYVIEQAALLVDGTIDKENDEENFGEVGGSVGLPTARFHSLDRAKAFVQLACALEKVDDDEQTFWNLLEASLLLDRRDHKEKP